MKDAPTPPGVDAWEPWSPRVIADHLASLSIPWSVVGGYAIDLFLGRNTRDHADLEIAILREDFSTVSTALSPLVPHSAGNGVVTYLGSSAPPDNIRQIWMLDDVTQKWRVDVMLEPGDSNTWIFRRNTEITLPREEMTGRRDNIPYLMPEGALLYKAKARREKDEADFAACLVSMSQLQKERLAAMLSVEYPDSPWIRWLG